MADKRIHFGHCIGCDQPIRPPYLSFVINVNKGPDGNTVSSWEEVDVCTACAAKLTVNDLRRLTTEEPEVVNAAA